MKSTNIINLFLNKFHFKILKKLTLISIKVFQKFIDSNYLNNLAINSEIFDKQTKIINKYIIQVKNKMPGYHIFNNETTIEYTIKELSKVIINDIENENSYLFKELIKNSILKTKLTEHLLLDDVYYKKIAADKLSGLNYTLPTALVTYPRSGSNFIQNVIEGSSMLRCRSIYAGPCFFPEMMLSIKSHALSYEYLIDEYIRLMPKAALPEKLIILFRDPRDVFISFYEFIQARKNITVDQNEFLKMDFYYATFLDKDNSLNRKNNFQSLNVLEAYKLHIKNWYNNAFNNVETLILKYEDILREPESEFSKILDFLHIDCKLNTSLLSKKVSQYSKNDETRGQAQRWKLVYKKYNMLIDMVTDELKEEIQLLNYEI